MNKFLGITAIAGAMLVASPAFAAWPNEEFHDYAPPYYEPYQQYQQQHYQYYQPHHPQAWQRYGIDARQQQQHWRIMQGLRSGELTRREARELMQDYRDIQREEHMYRADGHLSRYERRDLQRDLNELSRDIHRETHDGQQRRW